MFNRRRKQQTDTWMIEAALATIMLESGVEEVVLGRTAVEYALESYQSVRVLTTEDAMRVTLIERR